MSGPASRRRFALAIPVLALAVAACGGSAPPSASGTASAPPTGGSGAATPRPTSWPGNTVVAIESLGSSDAEIREAINDLARGIAEEDLALMRRAAAGLAEVDVLLPNARDLDIFPPMQPLGQGLQTTLPAISGAAGDLRDAIDAGDGEAIGESATRLTRALSDYAKLQPELARFVEESITQRRLLLR